MTTLSPPSSAAASPTAAVSMASTYSSWPWPTTSWDITARHVRASIASARSLREQKNLDAGHAGELVRFRARPKPYSPARPASCPKTSSPPYAERRSDDVDHLFQRRPIA